MMRDNPVASRFAVPTRRTLLAGVAAALAASAGGARAQEGRRITIVVGYPAAGATDIAARLMAEGLRAQLGATIIVENRPGAGARIAAVHVKNAKPDGNTLLWTISSPIVIYPHIYPKLPYDPLKDFVPVGIAGRSVLCLSIGPAVPESVKTLADYVAWVKANPTLGTFGTVSGAATHFVGLMFARAAGINLSLVPYKGGAQAITDVLSGQVPATVTPVSEAQPYQGGKLRTLAVASPQRVQTMPNVPTLTELGYPELSVRLWMGLLAPAGTPPAVVARLNDAMTKAARTSEVSAGLSRLGMEADSVWPEAFGAMIKSDFELFRKVVESTGFKAED